MVTYGARMNYRHTCPDYYIGYWTDRVRMLLEASVRDRHVVPDSNSIDVLFHEFMADDLATVEGIYEVAGLAMTNEARRQIVSYCDTHPRGKEGQVVYDLRGDFDTTPDDVRHNFDFYLDRFPVRLEVS
jgi:hypothetical protein